jgi:hypothetical protein
MYELAYVLYKFNQWEESARSPTKWIQVISKNLPSICCFPKPQQVILINLTLAFSASSQAGIVEDGFN